MDGDIQFGVSGMSVYVPRLRVPLQAWCDWTGNSWDKIQSVVGRSFRIPSRHENVYTMAANAVIRLIQQYDIDPTRVGFLGLGTESSTDNAAGAVIVRGMVDRGLEALGRPRLSRHMEVPEFKHACLGGMYALKAALRYAACDAGDRLAIVVCADIAEYERGSTGEQTQGAGAVAMLVSRNPQLFTVDLAHAGCASDYRGPDFRKPFARHFTKDYAPNTQRLNDFPVFSGRYSTFSYLDETVHAVEDMLRKLKVPASAYYDSVHSLFFHRPYQMMPVQALSFLYIRSLAHGEPHSGDLQALCDEAGVQMEDVIAESLTTPDLYAQVSEHGANVSDPYQATTAVASLARKSSRRFRELLQAKMRLGSGLACELGNLYSAALPAWLAAGFAEAAAARMELTDCEMVVVGYGSGDAAESWPIRAVSGWEQAAARIHVQGALENPIDLTREQYEALHDGREVDTRYTPQDEFVITHVGEQYGPAFQDLGIEYYKYAG